MCVCVCVCVYVCVCVCVRVCVNYLDKFYSESTVQSQTHHYCLKSSKKIFLCQLLPHLHENCPHNPFHSDYRPGHSTEKTVPTILSIQTTVPDTAPRPPCYALLIICYALWTKTTFLFYFYWIFLAVFDIIDKKILLFRLKTVHGIHCPVVSGTSNVYNQFDAVNNSASSSPLPPPHPPNIWSSGLSAASCTICFVRYSSFPTTALPARFLRSSSVAHMLQHFKRITRGFRFLQRRSETTYRRTLGILPLFPPSINDNLYLVLCSINDNIFSYYV